MHTLVLGMSEDAEIPPDALDLAHEGIDGLRASYVSLRPSVGHPRDIEDSNTGLGQLGDHLRMRDEPSTSAACNLGRQ